MKNLILGLLLAISSFAHAATVTSAGNPFQGGCVAGSACTGTTITATTGFVAGDGTVSAPSFKFDGATAGWYENAANQWTWTNGTDPYLSIFQSGTSQLRLHPSMWMSWTASNSTTTQDLVLSRYASKQLMISGDGTGASGNDGWIMGRDAVNGDGYSILNQSTAGAPTAANYVIRAGAGITSIGASGGAGAIVQVAPNNSAKTIWASTAGAGPSITAGTAASAVSALSITQTWNYATAAIDAISLDVTNTSSHVSSTLMNLKVGGVSTAGFVKDGSGFGALGFYQSAARSYNGANYWGVAFANAGTVDIYSGFAGVTAPVLRLSNSSTTVGALQLGSDSSYTFNSTASGVGTIDTGIGRKAAGIVSFDTTASGNGLGAMHLAERTAPSAPAANGAYIYAQDSGGGKTQLCALFASGAAQCFATEP